MAEMARETAHFWPQAANARDISFVLLWFSILTTLDWNSCLKTVPNVEKVIETLGLSHRVTIRLTKRSFTRALMKMLEETPRPVFDFAYIDGQLMRA